MRNTKCKWIVYRMHKASVRMNKNAIRYVWDLSMDRCRRWCVRLTLILIEALNWNQFDCHLLFSDRSEKICNQFTICARSPSVILFLIIRTHTFGTLVIAFSTEHDTRMRRVYLFSVHCKVINHIFRGMCACDYAYASHLFIYIVGNRKWPNTDALTYRIAFYCCLPPSCSCERVGVPFRDQAMPFDILFINLHSLSCFVQ